jgi:uncharacterized protein
LITDPWFYAVALPAVLLMGISKSGFGAGFGALATPLLAVVIPVPQAAAIMLPVLTVMDAFGVAALVRHCDRALLKLLLPAGLLGTAIGTASFGLFPVDTVSGIVGGVTLLFLAIRLVFPPKADAPPPPRWLGFVLGTASGFTSFVAHAGGPPIGFYVLPLRLTPVVTTATLAVFFAALNLSKWIPYAWLGLFDSRNLLTSLVLMPLAPVGVWIGVRIVKRISPKLFFRLFEIGLLLTGLKLLADGLR